MTPDSSLFVLWSNGRHAEDRILVDLERRFELVRLYEIVWSARHAVQSFRRFYSDLPVRGVYHALAKGRGPFLAAVVLDRDPDVTERDTSRGSRVVNAHFLDAKTEYRQWAGELTVHCTETPFETRRDLTMLLGTDAPSPGSLAKPGPATLERLVRDPVGAAGWTSEAELIEVLNRSVAYVMTGAPGYGTPGDLLRRPHVNLLTDDYLTLHAVLDARPRDARPHGGLHRVRIGGRWVPVRVRFVGDGFYDHAWAADLLASRRQDGTGPYRPSEEDDFAALVYDGYAHPPGRSEHDGARLTRLASEVGISDWTETRTSTQAVDAWVERWLEGRGYASVEAKDPSVPVRGRSPLRRRLSWWGDRVRQAVRGSYWRTRDQVLLSAPWLRPSHWAGRQGLGSTAGRFFRRPELFFLRRTALLGRGLIFYGRAYRCPCCGWSSRGFVAEWGLFGSNRDGYCPRCNAKARHRRLWLYMQEHMSLSAGSMRLLEVAPWWAISRRLMQAPNVRFIGLDLERRGPHVTVVGDATRIPLSAGSLDAALCTHTLEHIEDDRMAMRELHRVLKPGGWAIVSVPLRPEGPTYEDGTVTDPEGREREFGERSHVRFYGWDIEERLKEVGFSVDLDRADRIPDATRTRFGLRDDEHLFICRKAPVPA